MKKLNFIISILLISVGLISCEPEVTPPQYK